ncbi:MAG: MFS transporter [Prevotellaceae bacterium]|nr:MFS transporter [Prevotellaceae bacterium]
MLKFIRDFFRPAPAKPVLVEDKKRLVKLQWAVFLSSTIGYGLYYVCRMSFNIVKKPLVDEGIFSEQQLGIIGSTLMFSYAFGKFANGFMADRMNINRFMTFGLLLSSVINLALGFSHSFWMFVVLWGLNGWVQSIGSPSSVVALSRWMDDSQRGTFFGFGSIAQNIGKGFTYIGIAAIVSVGGWRWGFEASAFMGFVGVLLLYFFFHDSPPAKGLVPVMKAQERTASVGAMQKAVLRNPAIWVLALSSACLYICREAIDSWGIFFLQTNKGYEGIEASSIIGIAAAVGIVGPLLSGVVSDVWFGGSRNIPALFCGICNTVAMTVFVFVPAGYFWVDFVSMIVFGVSTSALVCYLGGMMAIDIAPKKASGAALGVVGVASYIGAGLQEIISGHLIGSNKSVVGDLIVYDFSTIRFFWIGAAVVSLLLCAALWNVKRR